MYKEESRIGMKAVFPDKNGYKRAKEKKNT